MTHGSLFSGIGGFDLAAEWMGWENKFHCEFNPFGQKVLKHYWPNAQLYDDITKSTFTFWRGKIDIISGGFPCQPYSTCGKRLGKEDSRHLFPEMLRVIREVKPRWVVGENVRGLVNWNGGMVFDEVQADLEAEGYQVIPFLLPAASVNAPHRRDRIWFIAYTNCASTKHPIQARWNLSSSNDFFGNASDSESQRQPSQQAWTAELRPSQGSGLYGGSRFGQIGGWERFPTVSPIHIGDDGLSDRLDGITFSKWRKESIKAAGNAVVPQVVYQIFKTIEAYENISKG